MNAQGNHSPRRRQNIENGDAKRCNAYVWPVGGSNETVMHIQQYFCPQNFKSMITAVAAVSPYLNRFHLALFRYCHVNKQQKMEQIPFPKMLRKRVLNESQKGSHTGRTLMLRSVCTVSCAVVSYAID